MSRLLRPLPEQISSANERQPNRLRVSAEQEPRSARSAGAGRYNVVFCRSRAYTPGVVHPSRWKCGLPFGPRSARGQGMGSPWTALRPAHRLPTPLPTGSTLNPHSHRHTQHYQVEFLMFRGRKAVRSGVVPYRQNTRKRTPIRSLEGSFFLSLFFNNLTKGVRKCTVSAPPETVHFRGCGNLFPILGKKILKT